VCVFFCVCVFVLFVLFFVFLFFVCFAHHAKATSMRSKDMRRKMSYLGERGGGVANSSSGSSKGSTPALYEVGEGRKREYERGHEKRAEVSG